jgi:hypothetical protein
MINDELKEILVDEVYEKLERYCLLLDVIDYSVDLKNKDRIILRYKTSVKPIIEYLVGSKLFEQFEVPYWSYLWGHKYKYSYREAVKKHSMQLTTDLSFEIEVDVDRYNPKYNLFGHLLYDVCLSGFKDEIIIKQEDEK